MSKIIKTEKNSAVITVPLVEMEKLGLSVGDEIEISKNERGEIVLHPVKDKRTKKILEATREIIKERKSALIELGKGHE